MQSFIAGPWIIVLGLLAAAVLGGVIGYILRGWRDDSRSIASSRASAPAGGSRARTSWAGPVGSGPGTRRVVTAAPPSRPDAWERAASGGAGATPTGPEPAVAAGLEEGDGPLVLLVDDRLELLALHGSYLHEHGYRVLTAQDGDAGLRYAREHRPSVIVLDHSMPRRSGLQVAQELKADPATRDIPILLMTAHSYGAVGVAAKQAGCETFLSKPVAPSRMLREVTVHLQGAVRGS